MTLTRSLYALSILAGVFAVWAVAAAIRLRRRMSKNLQRLTWIKTEARRAVDLVNSNDEGRVITGLQTLAAINERSARLAALQRIAELAKSENAVVAAHATRT